MEMCIQKFPVGSTVNIYVVNVNEYPRKKIYLYEVGTYMNAIRGVRDEVFQLNIRPYFGHPTSRNHVFSR